MFTAFEDLRMLGQIDHSMRLASLFSFLRLLFPFKQKISLLVQSSWLFKRSSHESVLERQIEFIGELEAGQSEVPTSRSYVPNRQCRWSSSQTISPSGSD